MTKTFNRSFFTTNIIKFGHICISPSIFAKLRLVLHLLIRKSLFLSSVLLQKTNGYLPLSNCSLKVYKQQMEENGTIPYTSTESASAEGSHESGGTAAASGEASHETGSGSSAESTGSSSSSESAAAAHKLAKRAIESVYPTPKDDYNPMMALQTTARQGHTPFRSYASSGGYLTYCQYALSSFALGATHQLLGTSSSSEHYLDSSTGGNSSGHHLVRRAASAEEDMSLTDAEKVFVYKTFLICGGLILVLNSLIKLLNTKITGSYIAATARF